MPTIDISHVDWAEVGPDLYLALKEVEDWMIQFEIYQRGYPGSGPILLQIRKALARVEGKE